MIKRVFRTSFIVIICTCLLLQISCSNRSNIDSHIKPKERSFSFEYIGRIRDLPKEAKKVDVWIPIPHNNKFQTISNLKISAPHEYKIYEGGFGNKFAHFLVENKGRKDFEISVEFDVVRTERINPTLRSKTPIKQATLTISESDKKRWLKANKLVATDGKIKEWAEEVVEKAGAKTDIEKARAIYNHIIATVKYDKSGTGWGRGDIYYACDERRGNCTDFHAIFIGYSRAVGIPARFAIGFPIPSKRGIGEIKGYHCWAEFHVKGYGWIPIDASEAAKNPEKREYFFGAHDENRIEFTTGRDLILNPRQEGESLNYFIYPYIEVDGKMFSNDSRQFKFKDVQRKPQTD